MIYFEKDFSSFFDELARNNNKAWFDENRKRYYTVVKEPVERLVTDLIEAYRSVDARIDLTYRQAIFRINRDVRFSKDKTPYKTYVGAVICAGGKKNMTDPCMYVELGADEIRLYSGLYMIDKDNLYKLRQYIVDHLDKFDKLLRDKKFVKIFGKVLGEKNKRLPKEFQEVANKQPLIYNNGFYYFTKYNSSLMWRAGLIERLMRDYEAAAGMNEFLRKGIGR